MENEHNYEVFSIELEGETIEFERDQAALFTFLGHTALEGDLSHYDHVFLVKEEEGEEEGTVQDIGLYIFKSKNEKFYNEARTHLQNNGYPLHLNMPEISAGDVAMWRHIHLSDLSDTMPEEWVHES